MSKHTTHKHTNTQSSAVTLTALPGFPLVEAGDSIAREIVQSLRDLQVQLSDDDIIVIAQKIVSKAEDRYVSLRDVTPGSAAQKLAREVDKDPRVVEIVLQESTEVLPARPGLLIVEQRSGWVCANAGIDRSNVGSEDEERARLLLLPQDSDYSAAQIRRELSALTDITPAVLINDSHGRAWRMGTVGVCIGCAGLPPLWDQRGSTDLFGYELVASEECIADELCAAATLMMGQGAEGVPVVLIQGYQAPDVAHRGAAEAIQRPREKDAFR